MKTDPSVKRILFYGDSFVFGKVSGQNKRLSSKTRFTGVLQDLLGDQYEVLEEGLRAGMLSGENKFFPDRDRLRQFHPIILSQLPVDLIVIFLGTNDCNAGDKDPADTASQLDQYPPLLKQAVEFLEVSTPKVLLVAPPSIIEAYYDEGSKKIFGSGAAVKVAALPKLYEAAARRLGLEFLNAAEYCQPAQGDGIHLDAENNQKLATAFQKKIKQLI